MSRDGAVAGLPGTARGCSVDAGPCRRRGGVGRAGWCRCTWCPWATGPSSQPAGPSLGPRAVRRRAAGCSAGRPVPRRLRSTVGLVAVGGRGCRDGARARVARRAALAGLGPRRGLSVSPDAGGRASRRPGAARPAPARAATRLGRGARASPPADAGRGPGDLLRRAGPARRAACWTARSSRGPAGDRRVEPGERARRAVRRGGRTRTPACEREMEEPVMSPRVVVLDYGSGNVRSAVRALERVGAEVELTADRGRGAGGATGCSCRASATSAPACAGCARSRGPG